MPRLAVVFVSYLKVPESRLLEHFEWNREVYESHRDQLRVYVVSDVEHPLPDYAETVVVPIEEMPVIDGRPVFSLCKTKNAGIETAIDRGAATVICTDVDVAFTGGSLAGMSEPRHNQALVPVYRMAASYAERLTGRLDYGCTGTVSMTADNWWQIQFDERCIGYGADDGILLRDIKRAELAVDRSFSVSHIAHVSGDGSRTPGSGSATCWGRESGFNFENFKKNRRLHEGREVK